jgi:hypothetical protein
MAFSLPSLPKLPTQLPGASLLPAAVLNVVSLISKNLPNFNPPAPIYAIVNADTFVPLTVPDSWLEINVRFSEYQVPDYPIEGGGFAAYNKVRRPDQIDMTLAKTGPDLSRATWLEAIRQQVESDPLARYHIITPQGIFQNQTIVREAFQARQDRGSNMLYLDIQFSEVPQITTPSLLGDKAVDPESGPMATIGRVYPSTTTAQVATLARANAPAGSTLAGA